MNNDKPSEVDTEISDSTAENTSDDSASDADTSTGKLRSSGMIAWLALLIAIIGVGGGYYLYQQSLRPLLQIPDSLAAYQQQTAEQITAQGKQLQKEIESLRQQQHVLQEANELDQQRFHGIEQNLAAVRGQAFWTTREWKLAEIKYLVQLAEDRIQLMQDVPTGETALLAALGRLAELSDPTLEPLRQRLQHDLQKLAAPSDQDPLQLIGKLETLAAQFKPYPRPPKPTPAKQEKTTEQGTTTAPSESLMGYLQSLLGARIKIVHHNDRLDPLEGNHVASQQLELLKMRIEALRLALLQKNRRFYDHELSGIKLWLQTNALGEQGEALAQEVAKLANIDPFVPLPSLQPTLDMINKLLATSRVATNDQPGQGL